MKMLRAIIGLVVPWALANLTRVALWALVVAAAFGAVSGALAYVVVREQTTACQAVACVAVLLGTFVFGGVAGLLLAAVRSLQKWVVESGLGPMASRALFAQALGVTDRRPEGKSELTRSLHGASLADAKGRLQEALGAVFSSRSLDRWLPAPGRWLMSRLVNTAGWAATRYAIAQIPGKPGADASFDLLTLRDQVGIRMEEQVTGLIAWRARAIAWSVLVIGNGVVISLVLLIRWAFGLFG